MDRVTANRCIVHVSVRGIAHATTSTKHEAAPLPAGRCLIALKANGENPMQSESQSYVSCSGRTGRHGTQDDIDRMRPVGVVSSGPACPCVARRGFARSGPVELEARVG